jgi:toxin ParE1/3/4
MRVKYLSLAVSDLAEIRSYIALHNPDAAVQVASKLRQSITSLKQFPNLGKPGRVFGTRELTTASLGKTSYVLVYRVWRDEIQILRILPGMRDIDAILEEGFGEE